MALKPRVKGIPRVTAYAALVSFANSVFASMTGNLLYPTPDPALASIQTAADNVATAIAAWGPVHARGSHAQLMDLRAKALILRNLLVSLAGYVQNTVVIAGGDYATQASNIVSSGFSVKNAGVPQGVLGEPTDLHQNFKNNISIYKVGLKWKKPVGITSPGNVKNFQIFRGLTSVFADANVIGTSTKTSFIDETTSALPNGSTVYYFVTASNSAGIGAPTAALPVVIVSI